MTEPHRVILTERDARILQLVSRFRLMSRNQIMALAPFRSFTRANTRLAALLHSRLLSRKLLPVYPGHGGAQALYFLGRASGSVLSIDPKFLSQQLRQTSRWDLRQVAHVIAANQGLSDAIEAAEKSSEVAIHEFRTEPELRQMFSDRRLVPDGWFSWTESGKRFNCFFEIDLHHEGLREWRAKVLRFVEYAESGVHQERFGFRSFRVCVLAKSAFRLQNLRHAAELAGGLFLFGQMAEVGATNFFGQTWLGARGTAPISLSEAKSI
jgi:Replication-relaxation